MTPSSIAMCYMLCMYIKEGNIQYLACGNKPALCVLLSSFRCNTWQLHMTRLCSDMVVSRIAMCSVWGHLCTHLYSHSQPGVFKFTRASSSQECCLSDHRVTPGVDVPCFPRCYAATQLRVQLELCTPSWHCRASQLRKLLSVRAHHTFQVKGWYFGLICFINHGALCSCNESELVLEKTKLYLGIACAGSAANAASVSTCWFLVPVCGGWTAFTFL